MTSTIYFLCLLYCLSNLDINRADWLNLNGAGASFPAKVYPSWIAAFKVGRVVSCGLWLVVMVSFCAVFLPPALAVEVIESESSFCVSVCVCLSVCEHSHGQTILTFDLDFWYGS